MVNFRRNKPGSTSAEFFLTIVTYNRKPWFDSSVSRANIQKALRVIRERYKIKIIAWVILPDHIHLLINTQEADYSEVVYSFKRFVSTGYRELGVILKGEKFWQDRFWEHTIRDDKDRERCMEYIHYNPVKHKYAENPRDWEHSSFRNYVKRGLYGTAWGCGVSVDVPGAEYD